VHKVEDMKTTILLGCAVTLLACSGSETGSSDEALAVESVNGITTLSYAPNSFVIGNAYSGWHDAVQGNAQFSKGPGNESGVSYRWGMVFGENFDHCAWINESDVTTDVDHPGALCGTPQEIDTPYFFATYTNGIHNDLAGDGSLTHMHYAGSGCSDTNGYGNVEPWRVPATPANSLGAVTDGKTLLWRYVSKDGNWVLVRDPSPPAESPNWYFVHRGCVSVANTD
jgi:hypothetical protein